MTELEAHAQLEKHKDAMSRPSYCESCFECHCHKCSIAREVIG